MFKQCPWSLITESIVPKGSPSFDHQAEGGGLKALVDCPFYFFAASLKCHLFLYFFFTVIDCWCYDNGLKLKKQPVKSKWEHIILKSVFSYDKGLV